MPDGGFDVHQVMSMLDALEASGVVDQDSVEELRGKVGDKYNASLSANEKQAQLDRAHGQNPAHRTYKYRDEKRGINVSSPVLPYPEPLEYTSVEPNGTVMRVINRRAPTGEGKARVEPNEQGHYTPRGRIESVPGGPLVRSLEPVQSHVGPGRLESLPGGAVVGPLRTHAPNPMTGSPALDFAVQRALRRIASQ